MKGRQASGKMKRSDVRIIACVLILCCIIFLLFVGLDAKASEVQYQINNLNNRISESENRIRTLEVKIKTASNISTIEKKALAMGMKYPGYDQMVHLGEQSEINEFALALIESVYR
jgi:predicted PurR-regulated permease PerM